MNAVVTAERNEWASWMERREWARSITEAIAAGEWDARGMERFRQLATDPKWEVRCEVAKALPWLSRSEFEELFPLLNQDPNSFVRRTAQQADLARRQSERQMTRTRQAAAHIDRQFEELSRRLGPEAAGHARRICDRYGELIAGSMVHDLRSVAGALTAACGTLINEGNRRRVAAVRVRENLDLLSRMLNDAESFVRTLPTDRSPERLASVVAEAVQIAGDHVRTNGFDLKRLTVHIEVPPRLTIPMTRRLVVMALVNLVKNAMESLVVSARELRAGTIAVVGTEESDGVVLRVQDDGAGMSPDELAECRKLLPGRRNKAKRFSTGYGLSIAARNIASQGGHLEIDSEEGRGTCVTLYLPQPATEAVA